MLTLNKSTLLIALLSPVQLIVALLLAGHFGELAVVVYSITLYIIVSYLHTKYYRRHWLAERAHAIAGWSYFWAMCLLWALPESILEVFL